MGKAKQMQPGVELPMRKEIHRVNNAVIKTLQYANTWHQIVQAADAAHHVFIHYEITEKECARAQQESGPFSHEWTPHEPDPNDTQKGPPK